MSTVWSMETKWLKPSQHRYGPLGVNDPHVDTEDDWSPETISRRQSEDPDIGPIFRAMKDGGEPPAWNNMLPASQSTKIYWTLWSSLELCNGVLYLRSEGTQTNGHLRLISPPCYREEIMHQAHAGFTGGHLGERRTIAQVRRRAYWPGWAAETKRACRQCNTCAQYKRGTAPRQGPLQAMTVGMPWERIGIDITGPHPKSRNGYVYMLTIMDYFTKWADAFPI